MFRVNSACGQCTAGGTLDSSIRDFRIDAICKVRYVRAAFNLKVVLNFSSPR